MSSKQVGEECFTTQKQKLKKEGTIRTIPQSLADDAGQMWPLFCYDMSISVDQEDKIAQLCKTCYDSDSLPSDRNETATANSVSRSLKHGVLYHGHASAHRHQTALLEVLTQEQSARFLRWFEANKDRCEHILGSETRRKEGSKFDTGNICADMKEASLDVLCQQLKDALGEVETLSTLPHLAAKLAELMPLYSNDVKAVMASERKTIPDDEITAVLEIVRQHIGFE